MLKFLFARLRFGDPVNPNSSNTVGVSQHSQRGLHESEADEVF